MSVYGAGKITGSAGNDSIHGTEGSDTIVGADGDDVLNGGAGEDVLHGGIGDDVLIGGAGLDRLYGGPGSDRFVFNLNRLGETDEIMDFKPEEGDTVWLQLEKSAKPKKKPSTTLEIENLSVKYNRLSVDNVRLDFNGDVEFRFEGDSWVKVAKVKRSDLRVKVRKHGSNLRLVFSQKF